MKGLMQDRPLLISSLIEHANHCHPGAEIVSRTVEGPIHRCTYGDIHRRAKQVANGARRARRRARATGSATLAWNGYRHMELYFGVSGMGAVLHTINPRLFPEQIDVHRQPRRGPVPVLRPHVRAAVEKLAPGDDDGQGLRRDDRPRAHAGARASRTCSATRSWSARRTATTTGPRSTSTRPRRSATRRARPAIRRACCIRTARRCCTRARSCMVDGLGLSSAESALLVVPMFHVNAWGMPYAGAMSGAKLVHARPGLDGKSVYELMKRREGDAGAGRADRLADAVQHVEAAGLDPKKDLVPASAWSSAAPPRRAR